MENKKVKNIIGVFVLVPLFILSGYLILHFAIPKCDHRGDSLRPSIASLVSGFQLQFESDPNRFKAVVSGMELKRWYMSSMSSGDLETILECGGLVAVFSDNFYDKDYSGPAILVQVDGVMYIGNHDWSVEECGVDDTFDDVISENYSGKVLVIKTE